MISIEIDGIEYRFFDHLFAVSRCGKVLRKLAPYEPITRNDGYLALGRERLMHRVVAACWCENPTSAKHVHHINGDKADNRAENLEWVTPKEHFSERHHGESGRYSRSEATIQKLRANRTGKKDSDKTKEMKRKILSKVGPKSPCRYNRQDFPSVASAARFAGIPPATFRVRCLSKNFPEYELLATYYS